MTGRVVALADWQRKYSGMTEWMQLIDRRSTFERAAGRSPGTIYQHRYHVLRFARAVGVSPRAVDVEQLAAYLAREGWKPATRRAARAALRGFFRWARALELIERDPSALLLAVRQPASLPRPAPLSAVQVGLDVSDERVRLMVRLAAYAGLRCIEISRVHSSDLVETLIGQSLRVHGKGDRVRLVPIDDHLARDLGKYSGFVFPGQRDGHLSAEYVSKLISRALPAGVTAHMLRHRYGSRAYSLGGKDLRAVQTLLGHANVSTTQIYTAVDDDALLQAARAAA